MLTKLFGAVSGAGSRSSDDLVQRYLRQRKATQRLMHQAMELLRKSDLEQAAKSLGMWRKGVIVFPSEEMSSVLMNFALLEIRHEGLTTVERFRADSSLYDPDDAAVVDVLCRAQFRLLTVLRQAGNACLEVSDQLTGKEGALVDVHLGKTAVRGLTLATHVWDLDGDHWITTGAALPYSQATEQLLSRRIQGICRCKLKDWLKLGPRQRSAVTALVSRCCLDTGSADQMTYA